jgi:catechol 2,3-dioxygenase-like lactoylglutathione lyase family enzyme
MIANRGLTHLHLYVRDLARSQRFYEEVFGFKEQMRFPGIVFLGSPGGHDSVALHEAEDMKAKAGDNGGYAHFGLFADGEADVEGWAAEVEAAGGRALERGEHAPGVPYLIVADPDGYRIEL